MKISIPSVMPCKENNYICAADSARLQDRVLKINLERQEQCLYNLTNGPEEDHGKNLNKYNLASLQAQILSCSSCSLRSSCKLPVPLECSTGINLVVALGEAPGADEDEQNIPFVGSSGQLLRSTCQKANLHISAYLNTCCCRPPQNRPPKSEEIKACRPNLISQLEFLDPWLIVCFGSTPLKTLNSDFSIMRDHGTLFPVSLPELSKTIWACGVFHPSFVLRNRGQDPKQKLIQRQWVEDLQYLAEIVKLHEYFGAEPLHPLMKEVRRAAPYIPGEPAKTEEAKKLYLERLEEISDSKGSQNYGLPESGDESPTRIPEPKPDYQLPRGSDIDDLPF